MYGLDQHVHVVDPRQTVQPICRRQRKTAADNLLRPQALPHRMSVADAIMAAVSNPHLAPGSTRRLHHNGRELRA